MILDICTYGDPRLRKKSTPVNEPDEALHELAKNMVDTMHDADGLGLAAQQIGRTECICIIDIPPDMDQDADGSPLNPHVTMPLILLNPLMVEHSDKMAPREEGCLSFPKIYGSVSRPAEIVLTYMTLEGKVEENILLKGMVARAVQHELDHLNGVVFIDHLSYVKKMALKGKLKRLKQNTLDALDNQHVLF